MKISYRAKFIVHSLLTAVIVQTARAAVMVASEASLSAPAVNAASIVHFDEVAANTAINGLTIKGFTFSENSPNAVATAAGGPGPTNHISPPEALSLSALNTATYVLTITMPVPETSFGFGFAVLNLVPTANALTITLFNGLTNVGALSYAGVPDPTFDGGFAGIASTQAFTSAQITFSAPATAFAIDNMAASSAVPEPATALFGLALCGVAAVRRRG